MQSAANKTLNSQSGAFRESPRTSVLGLKRGALSPIESEKVTNNLHAITWKRYEIKGCRAKVSIRLFNCIRRRDPIGSLSTTFQIQIGLRVLSISTEIADLE